MTTRQFCIAGLAVLLASVSSSAVAGPFNPRSFCTAVESKALELNPPHATVLYQYQTELAVAADVLESDSEAVLNAKIRKFINANMPRLTCNMINFNPRDGNILKLAVARQFDGFINDALDQWKIDLNQIDKADGLTVLDYIRDRRALAGPTYARTLGRYYERFRRAGAKHASELR